MLVLWNKQPCNVSKSYTYIPSRTKCIAKLALQLAKLALQPGQTASHKATCLVYTELAKSLHCAGTKALYVQYTHTESVLAIPLQLQLQWHAVL